MKISKTLTINAMIACLGFLSCKPDIEDPKTPTACDMTINNSHGPKAGTEFISLDTDYDENIIDSLVGISGSDKILGLYLYR